MDFDPRRFGLKLRELRESVGERGLSQKQLADAAGLSQRAISQWELGDREPLWSNVLALAAALGVDVHAFIEPPATPDAPKPGRGRPKGAATDGAGGTPPAKKGKAK